MGPSRPKSHRIENSLLESLRASLKEEITSEIRSLLIESQKEMLKLLKPKTGENMRENTEEETENETRSFYTPTKSELIQTKTMTLTRVVTEPILFCISVADCRGYGSIDLRTPVKNS